MIYTLTFNPSLDYIAYTDDLAEGKIHKISDYELFPGGKGINVSQVLSELGLESVAWGFVAGVTGESLKKLLDDKHIACDFIEMPEGLTRINVKLRHCATKKDISSAVTETDFNGVGLNISEGAIEELTDKIKTLSAEDVLAVSGSIPSSVSLETFNNILDILDNTGAKLIADITGDYLEIALRHTPFLVKPNEEELKEFYKNRHRLLTKLVDNGLVENYSIEDMAGYLKEMGAENVLVSLGENGAFLMTKEGDNYKMEPPHGKVVNTVGAGDSMVAGFIAGVYRNGIFDIANEDDKCSYTEALRLAVCAGSASAFSKGLATNELIERLVDGL